MYKKDQGESKTNGLTSPLNDGTNWTDTRTKIMAYMISPTVKKVQEDHYYKEVNRNLSSWPLAQKIGALPAKLNGCQF